MSGASEGANDWAHRSRDGWVKKILSAQQPSHSVACPLVHSSIWRVNFMLLGRCLSVPYIKEEEEEGQEGDVRRRILRPRLHKDGIFWNRPFSKVLSNKKLCLDVASLKMFAFRPNQQKRLKALQFLCQALCGSVSSLLEGGEEEDLEHVNKNVQFRPLKMPASCINAKSKQRILLFSVKPVFV